jgi:multidrug efflux pump
VSQTSQPGGHGQHREFGVTRLALHHRTSVLVMLAIIFLLGIASYRAVPKEASPEITIPLISISTVYPGVAPKDIETLVTRVVEDEVNRIPQIKQLTSTSVEGYSHVLAEFATDMNMEEALQKVRERIDLARPKLPADAEDPILTEYNLSEFPIMQVNISGEYGLVRLKDVAESIKDRLDQIPSILEVRLAGGLEREVRVEVDLPKLKFYGVAFADVLDAIRDENVTVPGGSIDVGSQKYLVRVAGEFEDTRIIEDIVVVTRDGQPIYVRDVATVDFGFKERDSYARLDGHPVVTLDIVKRSGENIIETAEAVKGVIARMESTFPPTTVVKITSDQSEDIRKMVANLENNIVSGLLLVLAVLLFFLGVRNAGFVAVSIPLSMLLSFIVMNAVGISMNMVVLFSLILALGMLVDNAIVIVENIYRHLELGYDNTRAALLAVGEVAMPVIASTLTTLAAFAPLMFWPGIAGEFMKFLPATLIITLSSSLFIALVIVPVLCAIFMRIDGAPSAPPTRAARWTMLAAAGLLFLVIARGSLLAGVLITLTLTAVVLLHRFVLARVARWFQARALPAIVADYERRLDWALRHRLLIMGSAFGVLVATVMVFGRYNSGVEYFPESIPPAQAYVRIDVPSGTNAAFTTLLAERVEEQLKELPGYEDIVSVVTTTAGSGGGTNLFASGAEGTVAVSFADFEERSHDVFATLKTMQDRVGAGLAGATFKVEKPPNGPPTGKPVTVEITGEDSERLKALGERAIEILKASAVYPRLEGLESDMTRGRPELVVEVDREKAALYGLNTSKVGGTVRTAIQGSEAAKYRSGNDEYDIVVRLAEPYRNDLEALQDLTIMTEGGQQIPLPSVASWRIDEGYGSVQRKDLDRMVTVSSDVRAGENSNAVLEDVKRVLAGFERELPPGYMLRYGGQMDDQQEAQEFLSGAFLLALLLIGFILVTQFNSVIKPLIILTSVLLSTVGVLLGLLVFRMPFGIIMTGVGVISLAGVVVNNAIVLIDYIDLLRERDGLSRRDALIRAGATRFRPVVLTAITTILGLVPLAIGFNFDFVGLFTALDPNLFWGGEQAAWWGPMAIAVIVGLAFATLLTLVLVPVMYSLVDDLGEFFRRHYTQPAEAEATVAVEAAAEGALPEPGPGRTRRPAVLARTSEAFGGAGG